MAKAKPQQFRTLFEYEIAPPAGAVDDGIIDALDFERPSRPAPDFLDLIHRQHDGYIAICKKRTAEERNALPPNFNGSPDFENLVSIPARSLPGLFTQVIDALEVDAYSTINGIKRGAFWGNKRGYVDAEGKLLPAGERKNYLVKWLTSCWVDIDCVAHGVTFGQAIGAVIDAVGNGSIPRPSILLDSGRGCWCFWLLEGASPADPLLRTEQNFNLWQAAQGRIVKTFQQIGGDAKSIDAARICRIPGSINSKIARRASYFPWLDLSGVIRTYKLPDLARQFGLDPTIVPPRPEVERPRIEPPPPKPFVRKGPQKIADLIGDIAHRYKRQAEGPKDPVKQRAGALGKITRWNNDRQRFFKLLRLRGCVEVGNRNNMIFVLAAINRRRHYNKEQNLEDIRQHLLPLLDNDDNTLHAAAISTLESVYANKSSQNLQHQTIADWLDVTVSESKEIGWPPAAKFGTVAPKQTPAQVKELRHKKIREVVAANGGTVPSSRAMHQALMLAGIPIGKSAWRTVKNDYDELGLVSDGKAGRKARPTAADPQLFE